MTLSSPAWSRSYALGGYEERAAPAHKGWNAGAWAVIASPGRDVAMRLAYPIGDS